MSQPPPYNRQASFANLQALNPSGQPPGNTMDAEFNAVKTTLDATLADLALIQNDDGTLANQSVGPAQLSSQLVLGFNAPTVWVTAHAYTASPASTVLQGTALYICLVSHTSGVFATDLAAAKWLKVVDLSTLTFGTAAQIGVSASGNIQTNVQVSLQNLDSNKAAASHTHTASQISDSTTAGRAMLTAANLAAQQALLGLGSLAFLSSVPATTAIPGQLAFTPAISSSVAASNNDLTPTGWATAAVARLTCGSDFTITGFGATSDGDLKFVQNVSAFSMTLLPNSTSSSSANRIACSRPLVIGPGQAIGLQYDGANNIWRITSPMYGEPVSGARRNLRVGNVANYLGDSAPGTPNSQAYINVDAISLKDANGRSWLTGGSFTADATVVGANGIDAGALGASTWYSLWVIGNPSTNTTAGLISTSATAPTLPSGYTFKARVGWMRTDGSSHFLKTLQYDRTARYVAAAAYPVMQSGNQTVWTAVPVANFVPTTATKIGIAVIDASGSGLVAAAPNNTLTDATKAPLVLQFASTMEAWWMLESSNIYYGSSTGSASTALWCVGWEDNI